jgi:hypothetical protein
MKKKNELNRVTGKHKHTSQASNKASLKTSSMNKSKRRSSKPYVGQGK